MKAIEKGLFVVILIFYSLVTKAQWQGCNVTCNSFGNSFIESAGILITSGDCASTDSGNTWMSMGTGISAICLGKNSNGLFAGSDSAIYLSNSNGLSWTNVHTIGSNNFSFGLAFLNDTIFACTYKNGVIMSPDNGSTWTTLNNGLTNDSIYCILSKGNLLFVGTIGGGIFMSSNAGANWTPVNVGLPAPLVVRCLATDGINIYAGTWPWNVPAHGMYISSNDGASWTQVTNGISTSSPIHSIVSIGNVMLAGGGTDIYRSFDSGATWSPFSNGMPNCVFGIGSFYETASYVFCGIESQCGNIYRINRNEVITSVNENDKNSMLKIYPNPFTTELLIKDTKPQAQIILFDITGKQILKQKTLDAETKINTEKLLPGFYFVNYTEGNKTANFKVIKN